MTEREFRIEIVKYYGPWPERQLPSIREYTEHLPAWMLAPLLSELKLEVSSKYGKPPDIADMVPIVNRMYTEHEEGRTPDYSRPQIEDDGCLPRGEAARKLGEIVENLASSKRVRGE